MIKRDSVVKNVFINSGADDHTKVAYLRSLIYRNNIWIIFCLYDRKIYLVSILTCRKKFVWLRFKIYEVF